MRIVLLVFVLVMAPTAAFFLWAWAVKIKQERKLAGTLPVWQDMPLTWLAIAGLACAILGFVVMFLPRTRATADCSRHEARRQNRPAGMDVGRAEPAPVRGPCGGRHCRALRRRLRAQCRARPGAIDDLDLAVDRPPEAVMRALEAAKVKTVPTGLRHGTVTAIADSRVFELTTLRRDVETDGRRAIVAFTDDWLEDAGRRDFTFNALYADPDGTLYDPFDGRADLAAGRVRFIGDADTRIAEDRLRVLRFFRFHAWYGQPPLDGAGYQACARNASALEACPAKGCARSCCARSRRRARSMRSRPWAAQACSITGCRSMTAWRGCAR
jgi:hypothetical protein